MANPLSSKEAGTFSYKGDSFSTEKLCGIQKTRTFFEWQIPCPARKLELFPIKVTVFQQKNCAAFKKYGRFLNGKSLYPARNLELFFNYQFTEMILIDLNLYILSIKFFLSAYLRVSDLEPLCSLSLR